MRERLGSLLIAHGFWGPALMTGTGFVDAVLGGIYRASDGLGVGGFIPHSLFSGMVFVCGIFTLDALRTGRRSALVWAALAMTPAILRAFYKPVPTGTLGDDGTLILTATSVSLLVVLLLRATRKGLQTPPQK